MGRGERPDFPQDLRLPVAGAARMLIGLELRRLLRRRYPRLTDALPAQDFEASSGPADWISGTHEDPQRPEDHQPQAPRGQAGAGRLS